MTQTIKISALAALSLLVSCNRHEQPPVNIICLVDFSPSRDSAIIKWYKETVKGYVLGKMGPKDRLIVLPIDFNSTTAGEEIFSADFSRNEYGNEFAGLQKDEIETRNHADSVNAAMQRFVISFERTKAERQRLLVQGTDIFGALRQCRRYYRNGSRNVVIILSDMLQYIGNTNMDFEDHLNTAADVERYLSLAEKADLKDMDIIVLTGAEDNMSPEKFKIVETFWERYLTQCNGKLIDYSSGAVSKMDMVFVNQTDSK